MTASREVGFRLDPVLVGRAAAVESLDAAVATVRAGRSVAVEVCGEAGLGKTRILRELARRAADAGLLVRTGRATQYEQGVPFGLFAEMVEAADGGPDDAASSVPAAVRRMLTRTPAPGAALLLDDVHWADSASLELTEHLLGSPPPVPVLLAVAFRSACPPARLVNAIARLGPAATLIDLPPLDAASLDVLLVGVPRRRRELILRASLGNPLYIKALSRLDDDELDSLARLATGTTRSTPTASPDRGDPCWPDSPPRSPPSNRRCSGSPTSPRWSATTPPSTSSDTSPACRCPWSPRRWTSSGGSACSTRTAGGCAIDTR